MNEQADETAAEGEILDDSEPKLALELRHPATPSSIDAIAALGTEGVKIIQARHQVMDTLRKASIMLTYPDDWLLFRTREGMVYAYLQDSGCDRVAPLWGIEVFGVCEKPERLAADDGSFVYIYTGNGRCSLTGQVVESMEGMRSSNDDIAKNAIGVMKEYIVRKSARANLDGSVLRELAGLKRVPLEELKAAAPDRKWEERAAKGRGYGSGGQRQAEREGEIDLTSPVPPCPKCGGEMWDNRRDKKNPRAPDFKCKKRGGVADCDGAKWLERTAPAQQAPTQQPTEAPAEQAGPTGAPPSGGANGNEAEEEVRLRRTIKSQFKGKKWSAAEQQAMIDEYLEACGKEHGGTLDGLKLDSLQEMHEELKKPTAQ